jgi:TATA element modulatory factor
MIVRSEHLRQQYNLRDVSCHCPQGMLVADNSTASVDLSRNSSNASATNDRLQERLARAMAKKNASRADSPVPDGLASSTTLPATDSQPGEEPSTTVKDTLGEEMTSDEAGLEDGIETSSKHDHATLSTTIVPASGQPSIEATTDGGLTSERPSTDISRRSADKQPQISAEETMELQEEMNMYLERIDALRRDMQTLLNTVADAARKGAESAKQEAASADVNSVEQKLHQKDERIALLIGEGTRLSKTEMELRATIKKARSQITASTKEQESTRLRAEKADRALKAAEDRARKSEAAQKRAEQTLAGSLASAKELEAIKKERDALNTTLVEIKSQLSKATARADAAESKAQAEQLEAEKVRTAELQRALDNAKMERESAEEKSRRELADVTAALEREKEQARNMESEILSEQAALESKLESFRVRAEEASSADTGHSQAKLLRQIETLQTQYASASQNWQGIETSLLGRITGIEKERDEVVAREADLRKKLRDTSLKLKNAERELDSSQTKCMDVDKSLADASSETQRIQRKATQLETELAAALKEIEDQKRIFEKDTQRKIEEEKTKWAASQLQRTESPAASLRKASGFGLDINHLMSPVAYERPVSRRSSVLPTTFESNTSLRQHSFRQLTNGSVTEPPSAMTTTDTDEYFADVPPTPLTTSQHSHRGGLPDLLSNSTVGTGPSVQLVERMSANVRRLESEKAASKDELVRLTTQRDEARQEVVNLMREVELKRKIEERMKVLETDHASLSQRHQTTLEILGEKSEQVEELKADILDVKQMYRQLADTMK